MARLRERIFAATGVAVILISAGALSGAVIIQQIMANNASSSNASTSQQASALSCTDTDTEPTVPAPSAYKPGAVTALQTTDLAVGSGRAAKNGDCLVVKYYGTLLDGTVFDENYDKPSAFAFQLGQGQVIQGWDQGLVGMKVGGERRLDIPANLAYGDQASGSIPANSPLVFQVKLLRIQ